MDYTTVARVKQEIHAISSIDDALLGLLVTAASRAIDRRCSGAPDAIDYFKLETVTDEALEGMINREGETIFCYPHKPIINSVTAFSYRQNVVSTEYTVDASRIMADGPRVEAYPSSMPIVDLPNKCRVKISYSGGLGATTSDLPDDLQECAAILAARFYREAETGLTDQIGVAELSTLQYTKAWPIRVTEQLAPYMRRVGWRHVS